MSRMMLAGDNVRLEIDILGYEDSDSPDESDANWLKCIVDLQASGLRVNFRLALSTVCLGSFHEQLLRVVSSMNGSASLEADEGQLLAVIEMQPYGAAALRLNVELTDGVRVTCAVRARSDQSYLQQAAEQLGAVVAEFPRIERSTN